MKIMFRGIAIVLIILMNGSIYGQFIKIYDFALPNATYPSQHSLIYDGTFLYGMTGTGGANSMGTIFKILPDGTGYTTIFNFSGTTTGEQPKGSLIYDGTYLYGLTSGGGINDIGVIFKIKTDGSGYSKLLDFNGTNGHTPRGSLISDGTYLYGMTSCGGTGTICQLSSLGCGIIFKIKLDGTGYSKLYDFGNTSADGSYPQGSLLLNGNSLYGMTNSGGANFGTPGVAGTIFRIQTDGTGYNKLLDFSGTTNGSNPYGSLITDGTYLYGMTHQGGNSSTCSYGCGVIFKIKYDGTSYVKLFDFSGTFGKNPKGDLFYDGTYLFGTTSTGGIGNGVVFKIKPDGTGYYKLHDFTGTINGTQPENTLISDGISLYGMTYLGGINGKGTIYKLGLATNIHETNKKNNICIFPNPSNGQFKISADDDISFGVNITDVLGRSIYQSEITDRKTEIDLSNQRNGVYFIIINTEEGATVQKIIIQKN